jgi:hypothetical protein
MYERDNERCRCEQVDNGIEDENGQERLNNLPTREGGNVATSERATNLAYASPLSGLSPVTSHHKLKQAPNR